MNPRLARWTVWLPAALLILGALCIMAGWQFRVPALKGAMFGTFVAPNTALLMLLTGLSVVLQLTSPRAVRVAGLLLGFAVLLISGLVLLEHATGIDVGVDRLMFPNRLSDWYVSYPLGRVAFPTVLAFFWAGFSLLVLRLKTRIPFADLGAAVVSAIAYLALIGYLLNLRSFYGKVMALPTALFLAITAWLLFAAAERGWFVAVAFSHEAGGIAWRRIGPAVIVVLPLLGWLRLWAQDKGLVWPELGIALFVVVTVFLFSIISLHTAAVLNRVDVERRAAQTALIRGEKLAAAGRMAASVAHEINNPLEAVTNLIYLGQTEPDLPPSVRRHLELADSELRRVANIARQTLGFYRGSSRIEPVDLATVVREVLSFCGGRASARNVSLRHALTGDLTVLADMGEVRQIISNLVVNAVEACPPDGTGEVLVTAAAADNDLVELQVRDNGRGISSEDLERLFEPFFTTKDHGTGLGLFVTRELVNKNGGAIRVLAGGWSPDGRGTTVAVTFQRGSQAASGWEPRSVTPQSDS